MNLTHEHQTTAVRICRECAELGVDAVTFELERFPGIAIIEFECALGHLQFEELPVPRPTHAQEHAA